MLWMDTLRGLAVILIVVGHVPGILRMHGVEGHALDATSSVVAFFAPMRVQALLILSGLLLERSLKKPIILYITGKIRHILYPLAVWTAVELLRRALMHGDLASAVTSMLNNSFLWYLEYVFVFYMVALAIRRIPPWATTAFILVALPALPDSVFLPAYYAAFFFFGWTLSSHLIGLLRICRNNYITAALCLATLGYCTANAFSKSNILFTFWGWPLSAVSVMTLIALCLRIQHTAPGRLFGWFGTSSVVVYVTHQTIQHLAVAPALTITNNVTLGACLIGALSFAIVTLFVFLEKKTPARYLFELPPTDGIKRRGKQSDPGAQASM